MPIVNPVLDSGAVHEKHVGEMLRLLTSKLLLMLPRERQFVEDTLRRFVESQRDGTPFTFSDKQFAWLASIAERFDR
jgi:hypothetical protein